MKNWFTDSRIEKRQEISFLDALIYELRDNSFENFDVYEGLDAIMTEAIESAAQDAFGYRFKGFRNYGKPSPMIIMGRTAPAHCVDIKTNVYVEYGGLIDFLADAGAFMRVTEAFQASIERRLAHYPVRVSMTHSGAYKRAASYQITLRLESRMPMRVAA